MEQSKKIARRLLTAFAFLGAIVAHSVAVHIADGPIITGPLWDAVAIIWLLTGIAGVATWGVTLLLRGQRQREDDQAARDRADLATVIGYGDHREDRSNKGAKVSDISRGRRIGNS